MGEVDLLASVTRVFVAHQWWLVLMTVIVTVQPSIRLREGASCRRLVLAQLREVPPVRRIIPKPMQRRRTRTLRILRIAHPTKAEPAPALELMTADLLDNTVTAPLAQLDIRLCKEFACSAFLWGERVLGPEGIGWCGDVLGWTQANKAQQACSPPAATATATATATARCASCTR